MQRSGGNESPTGTCISVVQLVEAFVVGCDSRSVIVWPPRPGFNKGYETLVSDKELKCVSVGNEIYATLCGSKKRIDQMLAFVKSKMLEVPLETRLRMSEFDLICDYMSTYFQRFPRPNNEHMTTIYVLGWHSHEQKYALSWVPDARASVVRLEDTQYGAGSGYPLVLQEGFDGEKVDINMKPDVAAEKTFKGLVRSALNGRYVGGSLRVFVLPKKEGGLGQLVSWRNRDLISELAGTDFLTGQIKEKIVFLIVDRVHQHIATPDDLEDYLNNQYQQDRNQNAAFVNWLGVREVSTASEKTEWLIYQILFHKVEDAKSWINGCTKLKNPIRRFQFAVKEWSCECYVARASRPLVGRMCTMKSIKDLYALA